MLVNFNRAGMQSIESPHSPHIIRTARELLDRDVTMACLALLQPPYPYRTRIVRPKAADR